MANPEYTFSLSAWQGGTEIARIEATPIYPASISKDFDKESGQMFFRAKLNGKFTFVGTDYDFITAQSFDTKFVVEVSASFQPGIYWKGYFYKTDCEFDADGKKIETSFAVDDDYKAVLDGLDKEFNLIELIPEIEPIKMDKRAMIQVYVAGQSTIGCYLSGMWWEQSCNAEDDDYKLKNTYLFARNKNLRVIEITAGLADNAEVPDVYYDDAPSDPSPIPAGGYSYTITNGGYAFSYRIYHPFSTSPDWREDISIIRISDNTIMWLKRTENVNNVRAVPYSVTLSPQAGSGAVGNVSIYVHDYRVYSRYVCDVTNAGGQATYPLPANDLVDNDRNYSRAVGYNISNTIWVWDKLASTPTEWGIFQPGKYYMKPPLYTAVFPMGRASWGRLSLWFAAYQFDSAIEPLFRKQYTLRDAFPLHSVISVLLGKIAPNITHADSSVYSQFLYGATNPITGANDMRVFISPKSNLVNSQYDQPAQKAPITLGQVLNMLRDCYKCYWWIEDGKLKIEHLAYFIGGGQYGGTPLTEIDLTAMEAIKNRKPWAFALNKFVYDKPETAGRYEFGWMDNETSPFNGAPINVISGYVEQGRVEEISVDNFSADVDYILLNPTDISNDGFVLLYAQEVGGEYELPYLQLTFGGLDVILQNGYASFAYLQRFYAYDMPAPDCEVDGGPFPVIGTKKLKRQEVTFPVWEDPDVLKFIKTNLGSGQIEKLSVNLCSRMAKATLSYDTE